MKKKSASPSGGKKTWIAAAFVILAAVVVGGKALVSTFGNTALGTANDPTFINAETGKVFHLKVTRQTPYPVVCPDTGKATGYEAEMCYWTADGHAKETPTPVLVNADRGLPGPTFCPDCGRLVVQNNPPAIEGHRPPPTKAEYEAAAAQHNRTSVIP